MKPPPFVDAALEPGPSDAEKPQVWSITTQFIYLNHLFKSFMYVFTGTSMDKTAILVIPE